MNWKKFTVLKEQSFTKKIFEVNPLQIQNICNQQNYFYHRLEVHFKQEIKVWRNFYKYINIIFVFSALHQTDIITPNLFLFTFCPSCNASVVVSGNLSFVVSGNLKAKRQSHQHFLPEFWQEFSNNSWTILQEFP